MAHVGDANSMRGANTGSNGPAKPVTPDTENVVTRWKLA